MMASVPPMMARGSVRCGIFHLAGSERQIGEAVVGVEHRDDRQTEQAGLYGRRRCREIGERRVGSTEQKCEHRQSGERAEFGDGGDGREGGANLRAADVDDGGEHDRDGGDDVGPRRDGCVAERALQILAEHGGDGTRR